jgi:3-hydroxyacyl-[acyl-carrier-protein] dehydratase
VRFLLVDRITQLESGVRASGVKNVTLSEDLFTHHFPEQPLMPGTLLLESMVQLADAIVREASDFQYLGILTQVTRLRLRRAVTPGDQIELEVKLKSTDGDTLTFEGQARVGGAASASTEFTLSRRLLADFEVPAEARRLFRLLQPRNIIDVG